MSTDTPLNPRQEKFARLYYAGPEHLRGNGRRCYMEAYDQDNPESADVGASRLLAREKVRARIRTRAQLIVATPSVSHGL